MRTLFRLVLLAAYLVVSNAALAQDRPRIVAVNYPLQYFAERLLGDEAEVIYPVPEGVDPSFWRPSIADISTIQSADLILLNGAGFATWTSKVSLPRSKLVDTSRGLEDRLIATESITHSHGEGGEHSHEGVAPYTWLDPSLATAQAEAIADAIKMRGLADSEVVDDRMAALAEDLKALNTRARETLQDARDTVFVATHPRYQYFARAYGQTILSLEWDSGAMPSDDELAELKVLAEESGATVLIWEAEPPASARDAVATLGLKDLVFEPLARAPISVRSFPDLFSDAVNTLAVAAEANARN
jgi:zinc transport system substrate-binding protein